MSKKSQLIALPVKGISKMKSTGFTILELLVVIAVLAVLTAITLPLLTAAKARATMMRCSSNLHQLSIGFSLYQQECETFPYGFSDLFIEKTGPPSPDGYAGTQTHDKAGWWWFNYLYGVLEIDQGPGSVLWCPSRKIEDIGVKKNILCGNYGVNRAVCVDAQGISTSPFSGPPLKPEHIRAPSHTLLIGDSGYSLTSWMAATEIAGEPFENPKRVNSFYIPGLEINHTRAELVGKADAIKGRHPHQRINLVFTDNHQESQSAEFFRCGQTSFSPDCLPQFWAP